MKVKEILNVTKGKMLCGNEELEVLERAKDLKRMNYSLFENCELNKSFLFLLCIYNVFLQIL